MSPPPREEADDYLNAHRHRKCKKRAGRHSRRNRRTVEEAEASSFALGSPESTIRSISDRCGSCGASTKASDGESVSDATLPPENKVQLKLNTNIPWNAQDTAEFNTVRVPTWSPFDIPATENRDPENRDVESPAVNALRLISQPLTPDTESRILRRVSTAFGATFGFLSSGRGSMDSSETSRKRSTASREEGQHRNNFSKRKCPSRRTTFKGLKGAATTLETPATITLRKASNMFVPSAVTSSLSSSVVNGDAYRPDPHAPTSELLAFYATPVVSGEISRRFSGPSLQISESSQNVQVGAPWYQDPSSPSEPRISNSISQFNDTDCYSSPAENTLTFTDVHTAPGSFAVESRSRKSSLAFPESLQRISVVHFRSRNSIHEVIWREDEATSGSSFASDSSSPPNQESRTKSPTLCPQGKSGPFIVEQADDAGLRISSFPEGREVNPEESLFQWSWTGPPASAKDIKPMETSANDRPRDAVPNSGTNETLINRRDSSSPLCSKPFPSDLREAQSVGQLRKRSSAFGRRRVSLEGPQDLISSGSQYFQGQSNTYFAGGGAGIPRMPTFSTVTMPTESERVHGTFTERRTSPRPHTTPRAGPRGSTGSSIGVSSHVRILPMHG